MCGEEPARALPHEAPVRVTTADSQAHELATSGAYSNSKRHSTAPAPLETGTGRICCLRPAANSSGLSDSRQRSSTEVLMRRIRIAVVLALGLALVPLAGGAQQFLGAKLVGEFELGDSVQALDNLTDPVDRFEYPVKLLT
jgi:hypothetical protein